MYRGYVSTCLKAIVNNVAAPYNGSEVTRITRSYTEIVAEREKPIDNRTSEEIIDGIKKKLGRT